MNKPNLTKHFFIERRKKLLENLKEKSTVFLLSNDLLQRNGDQTYPFRQSSELFYFTGINQEQTILVLCPEHPNPAYREALFIRRSSPEIELWEGHKLTPLEATELSGIENVYVYDTFDRILPEFMYYSENIYIGENDNFRYQRAYNDYSYRFIDKLKFLYPLHNYRRLAPITAQMRLVKTQEEINVIKYAVEITRQAFERVLKFIKPGVCECEIEAEITHEFLRHGVRSHAYQPIIASGKDNNVLHYIFNNKVCNEGELILMDFGAEYLNYAADLTRTVPVSGRFSPRQKQVYTAVQDVQQQMIRLIRPEQTINEINSLADELIGEKLKELGLSSSDSDVKKYFPHGLSHFMGLDVHDSGTKDTPLQQGMVLTVEPGIYIPEEGFGIRLENDIIVSENENIDLMKDFPLSVEVIEYLMNS